MRNNNLNEDLITEIIKEGVTQRMIPPHIAETLLESQRQLVFLIDDLLDELDKEVLNTLQWFFKDFFKGEVELIHLKNFAEATKKIKEIDKGLLTILLVDLIILKPEEKRNLTPEEETEIEERTISELKKFLKRWEAPLDPPYVMIISKHPDRVLHILEANWRAISKLELIAQLNTIRELNLSFEKINKKRYKDFDILFNLVEDATIHRLTNLLVYNTVNYKIKIDRQKQRISLFKKDYKEDKIDYIPMGFIDNFKRQNTFKAIVTVADKILQNFNKVSKEECRCSAQDFFQPYIEHGNITSYKGEIYDDIADIVDKVNEEGYEKIDRYLISEANQVCKPLLNRIGDFFITGKHGTGTYTLFTWDIEIV